MTSTLGGDGTILHASSLFATTGSVPPILSFSMGSLGFLGEWKFAEYKRAFREVYMSGAGAGSHLVRGDEHPHNHTPRATSSASSSSASTSLGDAGVAGWSSIRGKSMGPARSSKVLLRNRLKVGVFDASGNRINATDSHSPEPDNGNGDIHAMNEVLIHRGANPHLAIITILLNDRPLTEAVADGILISTPTGSTAYSLSSGGSIVHPLVSSLLVTPICPRSLSFRPLVLPANTRVTLRLSERNRGRDLEVSVDGKRRSLGVGVGMEVRVVGEECTPSGTTSLTGGMEVDANGRCGGGVPCIMRANAAGKLEEEDDGLVGGLNGLLKFNYPFGEES
jgi:NADH kinase